MEASKIIILYYSYTGNNQLLAEQIGNRLNCAVYPIIEKNKRNGLTIFLDVLFNRNVEINNQLPAVGNYEHAIFLAPLWAGKIASPMQSFLKAKRRNIQNYSFISFCGGSKNSWQKDKINKELFNLTGKKATQVLEIKVSDLFPDDQKNRVMAISKYKVQAEDLIVYDHQIEEFISIFQPLIGYNYDLTRANLFFRNQ